jgi:hypothetical protein
MAALTSAELHKLRQELRKDKYIITPEQAKAALLAHGFECGDDIGNADTFKHPEYGKVAVPKTDYLDVNSGARLVKKLDQVARDDAAKSTPGIKPVPVELPSGLQERFRGDQTDGMVTLHDKHPPYCFVTFKMGAGDLYGQLQTNATMLERISSSVREMVTAANDSYHIVLEDAGGSVHITQPDLHIDAGIAKDDPHFVVKFTEALREASQSAEHIALERLDILDELKKAGVRATLVPQSGWEAASGIRISGLKSHTEIPCYGDSIIPKQAFDDLKRLIQLTASNFSRRFADRHCTKETLPGDFVSKTGGPGGKIGK